MKLVSITTKAFAAALISAATVSAQLPVVFNTGVDDSGNPLPDATVDPHYKLISSADSTAPGPDAFTLVPGFPVGPWIAEGPTSRWIAPMANQGTGNKAGNYTYRTSIDLTGFDPATVVIDGLWAADNGVRLHLNGTEVANNQGGFGGFANFSLSSGFQPGLNHLDFVVSNAGLDPTGLRVELAVVSASTIDPNTPISIVTAPTDQTVRASGNVNFRVVAQGSAPVTYQWKKGGQDIPGATSAELTLRNVQTSDAGQYTVTVANGQNSITTTAVTLTVKNELDVSTGRYARLTLEGATGRTYRIDYAENGSLNWQQLATVVLAPNPLKIIDPNSPNKKSRLYRAAKVQ